MPKKVVYTCDCCGKEFCEPLPGDTTIFSKLDYSVVAPPSIDEKYPKIYQISKQKFENAIYLCDDCTKEFNSLLKKFGFEKLNSNGFGKNELFWL